MDYKKVLAWSFMVVATILLAMANASAFQFDNIKSFEKSSGKYGAYNITNLFGFGERLLRVQLIEHTDRCGAKEWDCYAIEKFNNYGNELTLSDVYDSTFGFEMKDVKKNNITVEIPHKLQIATELENYVESYKTICPDGAQNDVETNSSCYQEEIIGQRPVFIDWDYKNSKLPQGEFYIKLIVNKKPHDVIDWIPTIIGEELTEWKIMGEALYENYRATINGGDRVKTTEWRSQTITIGMTGANETMIVHNISMPIWRQGSPGTCTIGLRTTNSSGGINNEPDKVNGTIDCNSITTTTSGATWYNVSMTGGDTSYEWVAGETLGIVFRASGGDASNWAKWGRTDSGAYGGGYDSNHLSNNGGSSWNGVGASDLNFEIWGTTPSVAPTVDIDYPLNTTYSATQSLLNYTISGETPTDCWYTTDEGITNTSLTCGVNVTGLSSSEGSNTWKVYANESGNNIGSDSVTFTVDSIEPEISIIYPENTTYYTEVASANSTTIEINFTVSDATSSLDTCWYFNGTANNTLTCGNNASFTTAFGQYQWIVYANDSVGNVNSSTVTTTYDFVLISNSETYNSSVFETANETFQLNLTGDLISLVSNLWYNGSKYKATVTESNNNFISSRELDIPLVSADTTKNLFWELGYTNSTGTFYINTSVSTQEVNNTHLVLCNATHTSRIANFTTYDSQAITNQLNSTFSVTFDYWLGSGSVKANSSYMDTAEDVSNFEFCVTPNGTEQYYTDAIFTIDASGYSQNHYYFNEMKFNTTILEYPMYLLNESEATLTLIEVVNTLQQGLEDRLVYIYLYDVGTDTYTLVSIASTNHIGEDIVYLNWYDTFYRFLIVDIEGNVEKDVSAYKIESTPQRFEISDTTLFAQDKFDDVSYSLIFDNTTDEFILTFDGTGSGITGGCLRVVKTGLLNYTTEYDNCVNAELGTLTYGINRNESGRYLATFYARGSFFVFESYELIIAGANAIYEKIGNIDGTLLAIILVGTAAFMGLISPVISIFFLILGYIVAIALGFQSGDFIVTLTAFIIVGGFLMWKLKV